VAIHTKPSQPIKNPATTLQLILKWEHLAKAKELEMRHKLLTAMRWFLFFAWTSICAYAPAAEAMVGDYLSYFNIPPPGGRSDTIRNKLLVYINGATPGSEIRGHITYISLPEITQALIDAHGRGVQVFLVQYGGGVKYPGSSPQGDALEAYFGTRHKYCYEDRGPIGPSEEDLTSCVSSIDGATHHIKNWLFSNTVVDGVTRTYSVWVTSYNLTNGSNKEFNDVFIVNDKYELYAAYEKSYRHFYGQRRSDDFYNVAGRGHHVIASANSEISYSPQTRSPGSPTAGEEPYGRTNDHVAMALSRIDGYEPGCSLQVANLSFSSSRWAIIDELLRIRGLGCSVQIAFSRNYLSMTAMSELSSGQVELRHSTQTTIHSKMMLYKGRYDGTSGRTFVWGGSHNWNMASLRYNDEVFVAISRLGIYKSYSAYFDAIWARSTPVP
jgi:phosphatidylserine/phosphatidylglycerophosphate/cardiolipin synthase-like enzyme